jgi:uncharacterized lipoprotein YajG
MFNHSCLASVVIAAAALLCGCQTQPEAVFAAPEAHPAPAAPQQAAEPKAASSVSPNESVRDQYRRIEAQALIEEAKRLHQHGLYREASEKMGQANKLLKSGAEAE